MPSAADTGIGNLARSNVRLHHKVHVLEKALRNLRVTCRRTVMAAPASGLACRQTAHTALLLSAPSRLFSPLATGAQAFLGQSLDHPPVARTVCAFPLHTVELAAGVGR